MKKGIHPNYRPVVFQDVTSDFSFLTRSTLASKETVGIDRPTSDPTQRATGVMTTACLYTEIQRNTGNPCGEGA